jgi:hypothetical protein
VHDIFEKAIPVFHIVPTSDAPNMIQNLDCADLRYYGVKIIRFNAHSDVIGREALIDRYHSAVQLAED